MYYTTPMSKKCWKLKIISFCSVLDKVIFSTEFYVLCVRICLYIWYIISCVNIKVTIKIKRNFLNFWRDHNINLINDSVPARKDSAINKTQILTCIQVLQLKSQLISWPSIFNIQKMIRNKKEGKGTFSCITKSFKFKDSYNTINTHLNNNYRVVAQLFHSPWHM